MDTTALLALLVFIVPMCFTPGPNNMLCAAHGAQHGFRATLPLTFGMVTGWSILGVLVGLAIAAIESNQAIFNALTLVGAGYIAYLGYTIGRAEPKLLDEVDETDRLGFRTGMLLQFVNGKAWIHFLVLMATWGTLFGTGLLSKVALVALNAFVGYPAVLVWAGFGVGLRRVFTSPQNAKRLNIALGLSLIGVAVWIVLPH
ncbi:MAG: LysE family translocator [Euryarchaeota archaeon]